MTPELIAEVVDVVAVLLEVVIATDADAFASGSISSSDGNYQAKIKKKRNVYIISILINEAEK